ncbi:hypothetical protein ACS0TY_034525 [Phlomoides rotata]
MVELLSCFYDKFIVSTSFSLLHIAVDLVNEPKLDQEIKSWLVFAAQKVLEVNALAKALTGQKDEIHGKTELVTSSKRSVPLTWLFSTKTTILPLLDEKGMGMNSCSLIHQELIYTMMSAPEEGDQENISLMYLHFQRMT